MLAQFLTKLFKMSGAEHFDVLGRSTEDFIKVRHRQSRIDRQQKKQPKYSPVKMGRMINVVAPFFGSV